LQVLTGVPRAIVTAVKFQAPASKLPDPGIAELGTTQEHLAEKLAFPNPHGVPSSFSLSGSKRWPMSVQVEIAASLDV